VPAQSQQQQKLFGLALSVKRGDTPRSEVSKDIIKIVDTMSEKEIEDFAGTEHKGLPKKVEQKIREMARQTIRERMMGEAKFNRGDMVRVIDNPKYVMDKKKFAGKSGYVKNIMGRDVMVKFPNGRTILVDPKDLEMNPNESVNEARDFLVYNVQPKKVEAFLKKYKKVEPSMKPYLKGNLMKAYVKWLDWKNKNEDKLGGRPEKVDSPAFGSKTFYKFDGLPGWANVFQYLYYKINLKESVNEGDTLKQVKKGNSIILKKGNKIYATISQNPNKEFNWTVYFKKGGALSGYKTKEDAIARAQKMSDSFKSVINKIKGESVNEGMVKIEVDLFKNYNQRRPDKTVPMKIDDKTTLSKLLNHTTFKAMKDKYDYIELHYGDKFLGSAMAGTDNWEFKKGRGLQDTSFRESVNEGKKAFKVNPQIGKAKYSISFHDGKSKNKDGSDFWGIETFKNKVDLEKGIKNYKSKGFVQESVNEDFGTIALGVAGGLLLLKVLKFVAKKVIGGVARNATLSREVLHTTIESMTKELIKQKTKKPNGKLKDVSLEDIFRLKVVLKRLVDRGDIKTMNDIQKIIKKASNGKMESVNEANGEFVVYVEKDNGRKKLLHTKKSQRAANMFMSKNMDKILNKSGIRSIGSMSKDQWEKKEAQFAENIKKKGMKTVTKKEWDRTHKDFKGMIKGQPYMMWFDKQTQSTVYGPVHIKD